MWKMVKEWFKRRKENKLKDIYHTVCVRSIAYEWTDTNRTSVGSIIFQENGNGERRLLKEGDLSPKSHEQHPYWHNVALPWEHKCGEYKPATPKPKPSGKVVSLNDYR